MAGIYVLFLGVLWFFHICASAWPFRGSMMSDCKGLFSLFVDNLPEDVGLIWFGKFFNQYGVVREAYIPIKRSKVINRRFGFVRYDCASSAEVAIAKANGFWIEDRKLFVKLAAFEVQSNKLVVRRVVQDSTYISASGNISRGVDHCKQGTASHHVQLGKTDHCKGASFADVVKGRNVSPSICTIKAKVDTSVERDNWLSRSVIAKSPSRRSIESIRENFYMEGVFDVQIRALGGFYFLLTFPSIDDMKAMVEGSEVNWLGNFFEEYQPWSPNFAFEASREVWLECYGVPLHLWNHDTFFSIGKIWGEPITLDDATSKGSSFSSGRVQISSKNFGVIDQAINLEIDGRLYPIRVVKKSVTVNNLMRIACNCKCTKRDFLKNMKSDLEMGEVGESPNDVAVVAEVGESPNYVCSMEGSNVDASNDSKGFADLDLDASQTNEFDVSRSHYEVIGKGVTRVDDSTKVATCEEDGSKGNEDPSSLMTSPRPINQWIFQPLLMKTVIQAGVNYHFTRNGYAL